MSKKKSKNAKQLLQQQARDILGPGMFDYHCRAAAEKLGTTWDGNKAAGYSLLRTLVSRFYPGYKQPAPTPMKKGRERPGRSSVFRADPCSEEFLQSFEWRQLRMQVLQEFGRTCQCCGAKAPDVRINVDHIKPRKFFPQLALDRSNLQVLCGDCNHGKGNWDQTDWRPAPDTEPPPEPSKTLPRLVRVTKVTDKDFAPVWASKSVN